MYTPSDEVTMSDPNGNTLTWQKEGPALLWEEWGLMCGVIGSHAGLLQQAVMRIVWRVVQLTTSILPWVISR